MRRSYRRWMMGLAAAGMLGALYQTACAGFAGDQVLRSVDFCFLFDCQNGAFGGLINFCPNNETTGALLPSNNSNTFVDCPLPTTN
ncbi:MAG TPA: hypothetical protein P5572_13340 [Phycisphaerae bacterium]|nr:hypothetical protein [Phycisphaerales bacterium]HRX85997.1 hypothetical protein [Phycisphaerae bacterium]